MPLAGYHETTIQRSTNEAEQTTMKLEHQVCSIELAQRLKELHVNQKSTLYWVMCDDREAKLSDLEYAGQESWLNGMFAGVSAFTVAELGEMLPAKCRTHKSFSPDADAEHQWVIDGLDDRLFFGKTEADARAKMIIYILESKPT